MISIISPQFTNTLIGQDKIDKVVEQNSQNSSFILNTSHYYSYKGVTKPEQVVKDHNIKRCTGERFNYSKKRQEKLRVNDMKPNGNMGNDMFSKYST